MADVPSRRVSADGVSVGTRSSTSALGTEAFGSAETAGNKARAVLLGRVKACLSPAAPDSPGVQPGASLLQLGLGAGATGRREPAPPVFSQYSKQKNAEKRGGSSNRLPS